MDLIKKIKLTLYKSIDEAFDFNNIEDTDNKLNDTIIKNIEKDIIEFRKSLKIIFMQYFCNIFKIKYSGDYTILESPDKNLYMQLVLPIKHFTITVNNNYIDNITINTIIYNLLGITLNHKGYRFKIKENTVSLTTTGEIIFLLVIENDYFSIIIRNSTHLVKNLMGYKLKNINNFISLKYNTPTSQFFNNSLIFSILKLTDKSTKIFNDLTTNNIPITIKNIKDLIK